MNDRDSDSVARQNLDGAIDDIHARQPSPPRGRNLVVDILIRPMSILHSVAGVRHWIRIRIPFLLRTHYVYKLLNYYCWEVPFCSHTLDKLLYPFFTF